VTADRDHLRFYVDESALGLGKALEAARRDTVHAGHKLIPECPLGVLDPEWIPAVAASNLIVIARDRHIRTRPQELERFREADLRVFWIAGKRDMSTWGWLECPRFRGHLRALVERPGQEVRSASNQTAV
jgi:hypothetical protein